MEITFKDKGALVTGAGKGLGRATAKALWAAGATTYALSRTQSDLDSLQAECPGMHVICVDLSDWSATRAAIENLEPMDLLVNNAGIARFPTMQDVTEKDFDELYDINVKAVLNVSQVIARRMVDQKHGTIVNISSVYSARGTEGWILYNSAHGALEQLSRCMAVELGPHRIRVNTIQPTLMPATKMGSDALADYPEGGEDVLNRTPLRRFADVEQVVNAILYLLSDKADMISGAFLPVDGGWLCT